MESYLPSLDNFLRWGIKGGWGILDQGVYSGINFLVNILLARWLSAAGYGGFSVAFSVFLLISGIQVALIAEPMSIFGASKYRDRQSGYLNHLLRNQWLGSFLSCLILLPIVYFVQNSALQVSFLGMTLALPFIFGHWYVRRACYLEAQSGLALISSLVYAFSLLSVVVLLRETGYLSVFWTFIAMAVASVVASFTILERLQLKYFGDVSGVSLQAQEVFTEIWQYGKWILIAYTASWTATMAYPLLIAVSLGTQLAGAFRSVQNLFLPLQQFLAAVTLLILPWLTKQKSIHGESRVFQATRIVSWVVGTISAFYCAAAIIFRYEIMNILYENGFYSSFSSLILYLAVASLLGVVPLILGLSLRVLGQPEVILWSKGPAALCTLIIGLPLIWKFQMTGVVLSLILSVLVEAFVVFFYYLRVERLVGLKASGDLVS
jgi:O-antigen/teichoic acid export membrane protein